MKTTELPSHLHSFASALESILRNAISAPSMPRSMVTLSPAGEDADEPVVPLHREVVVALGLLARTADQDATHACAVALEAIYGVPVIPKQALALLELATQSDDLDYAESHTILLHCIPDCQVVCVLRGFPVSRFGCKWHVFDSAQTCIEVESLHQAQIVADQWRDSGKLPDMASFQKS